jgi:heat shock protein HtpX
MGIVAFSERVRAARARHRARSGLLLGGMGALLTVCAWLLGGSAMVIMAALVLLTILAVVPRLGPGPIMRMVRAVPIPARELPDIHALMAALADRAGLPAVPALYWHPDRTINAFAVGDADRAAIAVSDGALRHLSRDELAAVLAHEMSHVAAGDTAWMRLAGAIAQVTSTTAMIGLLMSVVAALGAGVAVPVWVVLAFAAAPTAATLLQLALSRNREFAADLEAARLTADPASLATALVKIERFKRRALGGLMGAGTVLVPPWLSTHPATRERIVRLAGHAGIDPNLLWQAAQIDASWRGGPWSGGWPPPGPWGRRPPGPSGWFGLPMRG